MLKYDSLFIRDTLEVKHLPNIKSAERRVRTEAKAKLRNRNVKSGLKTLAKKFNEAVAAKDKDKAAEFFKEYTSALDKAVLKGTIHKNSCARKKAQVSKALAAISA
jgi:small subunit ribosomal protein S20